MGLERQCQVLLWFNAKNILKIGQFWWCWPLCMMEKDWVRCSLRDVIIKKIAKRDGDNGQDHKNRDAEYKSELETWTKWRAGAPGESRVQIGGLSLLEKKQLLNSQSEAKKSQRMTKREILKGTGGKLRVKTEWLPSLCRNRNRRCCKWSHLVVSISLWPHGLYSPWNSPGQNTEVGSFSLLQGIFPAQVSRIAGGFFTSWTTREAQAMLGSLNGRENMRLFSTRKGDEETERDSPCGSCGDNVDEDKNWRRQWHTAPVLLPGESHGWRSLVGYSPWGR